MSNTLRGVGRSVSSALSRILIASTFSLPLGGCLGSIYQAERDRDTAFEVERRRQQFESNRGSNVLFQNSVAQVQPSPFYQFFAQNSPHNDKNGDRRIDTWELENTNNFSRTDQAYFFLCPSNPDSLDHNLRFEIFGYGGNTSKSLFVREDPFNFSTQTFILRVDLSYLPQDQDRLLIKWSIDDKVVATKQITVN